MPGTWETVYTTILVMGSAILAAKLARATPDLLIRPNVTIFRTLDFPQATAILRTADAVKAEVKEKLGALLGVEIRIVTACPLFVKQRFPVWRHRSIGSWRRLI